VPMSTRNLTLSLLEPERLALVMLMGMSRE
jgi:hypothetical protein